MENKIIVRKYEEKDLPAMIRIWNEVVEDGVAFPQEECLDEKTGAEFFAAQTYTAVAENCSLTQLWRAMFMQDIFMRELDFASWV